MQIIPIKYKTLMIKLKMKEAWPIIMDSTQAQKILIDLLNIPAINDNETDVAKYILQLFEPYLGNQVQAQLVNYAPNRDNLVLTIGHGHPVLGLSGHMDTVHPGDLDQWDTDPLKATIKDDRVYARGACDMKGGLAALLCTVLDLLAHDDLPNGTIKLLLSVGEESGEFGAAQLTDLGYADDLDALIIAEPSNDLKTVGYTAKGVIDYTVTAIGKGAHGSRPNMGINAIDHLVDFAVAVKKIMATFDQVNPVLGQLTHVQSVFDAGYQINSVPAKGIIKGNIRTIPEYPNQVIFDALNNLIAKLNQKPGYQLRIEYHFPEEAMPGDPNDPLIQLLSKVYETQFNEPLTPVGQTGASDGSEYCRSGKFPIAIIGPGGNMSHQSNEYLNLPVYLQAIKYYTAVIKQYFQA